MQKIKFMLLASLLLAGCIAATSYFMYDSKPTIHYRGVGKFNRGAIIYLTVSNPTYTRKEYTVVCRTKGIDLGPAATASKRVHIPPHSDVRVQLVTVISGEYKCHLQN